MSNPQPRRKDLTMDEAAVADLLKRGYCGRLASVAPDGWPYVLPLLYVCIDGYLYVHTMNAHGHLRSNIEHSTRVCFEVDEPGEVFAYGRFECDSAVSYRSVIAFGTARIVEDREEKARFCTALMDKYAQHLPSRPKDFFPRLDSITVYAITIERITGKAIPLPAASQQWPAHDRTKSPNAVTPT